MKKKIIITLMAIAFISSFANAQEKTKNSAGCKMSACLEKYSGNCEIPQGELKKITSVGIINECNANNYFVFSYDLTVVVKKQPVKLEGKGPKLTPEILSIISGLNPGDKIFIDMVKANSQTEKDKLIQGITVTVK